MHESIVYNLVHWLDLVGVAVFAVSGALEASRRQMDIVGFILIATVTGIGGGTIRDLLLGIGPVNWVSSPMVLVVCAAVALIVFFCAHLVEYRFKLLLWADAIGLAVFCIIGTDKALQLGVPSGVAILMGVITATFGGMVRDILCNEVPLILRKEIYATAAAAGASVYALMHHFEMPYAISVVASFSTAFIIRALALRLSLSLPTYRSRPGREV
jgi:uncharacterized membrane protein YeiH